MSNDIQVRDRLSERITSSRAKLEARRAGPNLAIFSAGVLIALIGAVWILGHVASNLVHSSRTYYFNVASARAVHPGLNEVRMKGVPAGRITGVKLVNGQAQIKVELEKKYGALYRDAHAQLRPNSALEDQFLDITSRGQASSGKADDKHPFLPSQTEVPIGIDDALSTFNANTRSRLRVLLDQLGHGLSDNGEQLQQAFASAIPLLQVGGNISKQLADRGPMTKRLVHNVGVLTHELALRDKEVRTLVSSGASTLSALQASSPNLDATLRELPPTLDAVNTSFKATSGVLGDVNTAVTSLNPVADRLPGSLKSVTKLSDEAAPALHALQTPVKKLVPLAKYLAPVSHNLDASVTRLRTQVPTLNHVTNDLVLCQKGIQGFFQFDASMTKFGDNRGQAPRGNVAVGAQTLGVASPFEYAYAGCTPGKPIGGRVPGAEDLH